MAVPLCSIFSLSDFLRKEYHCSKLWSTSRYPHPLVNISSSCNVQLPNRNCGVFASLKTRIEGETARRDVDGSPRPLRVGIICGGPSEERGISLNSARSVLDHVQGEDMHVSCYYLDCNLNAYAISSAQLYSNTPTDFDFKLKSLAQRFYSLAEFAEHLASATDIVFPAIHGKFGEDGGLQELLEKASVPFVGTPSKESKRAFDKYSASVKLNQHGFATVPNFLVQESSSRIDELYMWFSENKLNTHTGKVVVKPTRAGSSIGVSVAYGVDDSIRKANDIFLKGIDDKVVIEVFLEGREFTAIVLDTGSASECNPITLLPTEVELHFCNGHNIEEDAIFNYRRKYLPTQQVVYHTPPRFTTEVIDCIRQGASLLFRIFGLRDFARIDGWFLPSSDSTLISTKENNKFGHTTSGTVYFIDINLISGMEQTSFLFQQASKVGFSHSNILRTIIQHASLRFQQLQSHNSLLKASDRSLNPKSNNRRKVLVIFGGNTSERQVSLMSGTNIWLNLQIFNDLDVTPCLLASSDRYSPFKHNNEGNSKIVWTLPYSLVLRHTTEEVLAACVESVEPVRMALTTTLRNQVMNELLTAFQKHCWFMGFDIEDDLPLKFSLDEWIRQAKETDATVFIAG
ncbi:D-alanine--D-alanine ligase [Zostera marina]|uniref:D-alanine--D-alanine ligase n=1 Tax=Zostera marina TaxID=29655 RepID=A0A0K9PZ68_ZOSMR|nr:D-alanine--D-alanine ligase [Zostera marina]